MNDPYLIYYFLLAGLVTVTMAALAWQSYKLGHIAQGLTQRFLYSLVAVRLSTAIVQLFWVLLILFPLVLPLAWLQWQHYRLFVTALWTVSQLAVVWSAYYSWHTLHRKP